MPGRFSCFRKIARNHSRTKLSIHLKVFGCALCSLLRHYRRSAFALPLCVAHASTFLSPFPRSSFAFRPSRGSPRSGTMGDSDSCAAHLHSAALPAYLAPPSGRSVSNHVGLPEHRFVHHSQRVQQVSDFALGEQARRSSPTESSSLSYGPTVRLRLLPTPLRADAVTFGYGAVAYSDTDFHRADVAPSRAHSPPHAFSGGPVPNPPRFPLKACGNDGFRKGKLI